MKRRKFLYLSGCTACIGCAQSKDSQNASETNLSDTNEPVTEDTSDFLPPCTPSEQSLLIPLAEHPELREVGAWKSISFPQELIHLLVVHPAPKEWIAVWKYCSHGFCELEWSAIEGAIECPCHHSLFNTEGVVLVGPATEDIRSYSICEKDDVLYIETT